MAGSPGRVTLNDAVLFWAKVLILCFILGGISFYIGRNYLGRFMSESELRGGAPEIVAQVEDTNPDDGTEVKEGPDEAEIVVSERQGSDAEIARAARELNSSENGDADFRSTRSDTEDSADNETSDASAAEPKERSADQAPADDEGRFVVIAGSFLNTENSDRVVKELQDKGYQPYISKSVVNGKTYRRVNVGAFSSRSQATNMADELRADGYEVSVGVR